MESGPLTKLPGGLGGDVRVLSTFPGTLEKGGHIILLGINTEAQRKPGHKKAESCSPYFSPST